MSNGLWVVFEGADGTGKSTTMEEVARILRLRLHDVEVIETKHPGSTLLGAHIRELIKNPTLGMNIDPLSAQMLMFTDHINFKNTLLKPALERGAIVLADRCSLISGQVYGKATGVNQTQLNLLMQLAYNPKIDMLYILQCADEVQAQRLSRRSTADVFEAIEIRKNINEAYNNLMTASAESAIMTNRIVPLDSIKYIDTNQQTYRVTDQICNEICKRYVESLRNN